MSVFYQVLELLDNNVKKATFTSCK